MPTSTTQGPFHRAASAPRSPAQPAVAAPGEIRFTPSPGGVPEVDAAWLDENAARVRVVDVREAHEVAEGRLHGALHVPLARLADAARAWGTRDPIVLVCRSGRRSARGVHSLEALGFSHVASLTGGILSWRFAGKPLEGPPAGRDAAEDPSRAGRVALSAAGLEAALQGSPPRRVRAAALLLHGTESCVDGRDDHAVIGTPGGDAGELLLALATAEDMTGLELRKGDVVTLFDAYVEGFGRFYFHSDEHAVERLGESLRADPRFRGVDLAGGLEAVLDLVSRPPPELREPLLEHLVDPRHVGCGHLRLVLSDPAAYGVRLGLAQALGRVVFRLLWTQPEAVEHVVLCGEHAEEAVVNVTLPGEVHAFTNVPAIPPRIGGHSVFVNHPQVGAFIRKQHAHFLFEELPALRHGGFSLEDFERRLAEKADRQLALTIGALAADLPVFDLRYDEDGRPRVTLAGGGAS